MRTYKKTIEREIEDLFEKNRIMLSPMIWKFGLATKKELMLLIKDLIKANNKEFGKRLLKFNLINESGLDNRRESKILQMRFLELMTYEEVGVEWGITRERVRQIEFKALNRLERRRKFDNIKK